VVEKLPSYRPNQPFHKRMGHGQVWDRLVSSTSRMRKLATQRWNRNSGSWSELRC
jgi:hypothetical protein